MGKLHEPANDRFDQVPIGDLGEAISEAENVNDKEEVGKEPESASEISNEEFEDMWNNVTSEVEEEAGELNDTIVESDKLSEEDREDLSDRVGDAENKANRKLAIIANNSGISLEELETIMSQGDRLKEVREFFVPQVEVLDIGKDGVVDRFEFSGEVYSKQDSVGEGAGKEVFLIEKENHEQENSNVKSLAAIEGEKMIKHAVDEVVSLLELEVSGVENVVNIDGFFALDSKGNKVDFRLDQFITVDDGVVNYDMNKLSNYIEKNDIERFYIIEEYLEGADLGRMIPDLNGSDDGNIKDFVEDSIEEMELDQIKKEVLEIVSSSIEHEGSEEVAENYLDYKFNIIKNNYDNVSDRFVYEEILKEEKELQRVYNQIEERTSEFDEVFSVINDNVRGLKEGHDLGIAHGDVKFENMAYEEGGGNKIGKTIDYGSSKARDRYDGKSALASNGTPINLNQRGCSFDNIVIKNVQDTDTKGVIVDSLDNFVSIPFSMDKITRNGLGSEFRNPNISEEFNKVFSDKADGRQELGITLMRELGLDKEVISTLVKFETGEKSAEAIPGIDVAWEKFVNWWKNEFSKNINKMRAMKLIMSHLGSEKKMDDLIMEKQGESVLTSDGVKLIDLTRGLVGKEDVGIGNDYCEGATEDLYESLT